MPWDNPEEIPDNPASSSQNNEPLDDLAWLRAKQGLAPEPSSGKHHEAGNDEDNDNQEEDYEEVDFKTRQMRAETDKIAETSRLFVRNLPPLVDEEALRAHFARFGQVVR